MQYLGGKFRIASQLVPFLEAQRHPAQLYIEPFVGGASVLAKMTGPRLASDICEDLILMYQALQQGWHPPTTISEAEYRILRTAPSSALRGFAGFGCSFGGKWFGGYARSGTRNYAMNAANSLEKLRPLIQSVQFKVCAFQDVDAEDALIYCDPPYAATTGYDYTCQSFSADTFWEWCRLQSEKNTVLISEYAAPADFDCVAEFMTKTDLHTKVGKASRIERVFKWRGGK